MCVQDDLMNFSLIKDFALLTTMLRIVTKIIKLSHSQQCMYSGS